MKYKAITIWLTGLPCSGKTSIAKVVAKFMKERGYKIEILDGNDFRKKFNSDLGFSKEDRIKNLRRATSLAKILNRHGVYVIAAFVSPYQCIRDEIRKKIKNFVEIYIRCTKKICIKRDKKGLYRKALAGRIRNFTGINDPYEKPRNPEFVIDTRRGTVLENGEKIFKYLVKKKLI